MIRLASVYNGWLFKCISNSMSYDGTDEGIITPSETGLYTYHASLGNPAGIIDHIGIVHSNIIEGQNQAVDFLPLAFTLHQNLCYINGICELIAGKKYMITTYVKNNAGNANSRLILILYKKP
jgi:hypothetical protein